jgi:hypothetical protein
LRSPFAQTTLPPATAVHACILDSPVPFSIDSVGVIDVKFTAWMRQDRALKKMAVPVAASPPHA